MNAQVSPDPALEAETMSPSMVRRLLGSALVALPLGVFFAYGVIAAYGNLAGMVANANLLQLPIVWWGWVVLIAAILLPAALWILSVVLGWRRSIGQKLLLTVTLLALSNVLAFSIVTMFNDTNLFVLN